MNIDNYWNAKESWQSFTAENAKEKYKGKWLILNIIMPKWKEPKILWRYIDIFRLLYKRLRLNYLIETLRYSDTFSSALAWAWHERLTVSCGWPLKIRYSELDFLQPEFDRLPSNTWVPVFSLQRNPIFKSLSSGLWSLPPPRPEGTPRLISCFRS